MELLRLRLCPEVDKADFRVSVSLPPRFGEGETRSKLPFFENGIDRRRTVQNALGASKFKSEDFQDIGEQDWMVENYLLTKDKSHFHPDMHANIGKALYQALFREDSRVKAAFQYAKNLAQSQGIELHVQLQTDADVKEQVLLHAYPWELLHDDRDFLAHQRVIFSRYINFEGVPPNLPQIKQVNVLLVSSAAFDCNNNLPQLPKDEQKAIRQVLSKAKNNGLIRFNELKPATFKNLREYLNEHRGDEVPHVIHFDGHGIFGRRCRQCGKLYQGIKVDQCKLPCGAQLPEAQGYLVFENGADEADYRSAREIGNLIRQYPGVAVVVLSACKSGVSLGSNSLFNGVAQNLIFHQLPAVVAMQYSVRVDGATAFTEQFYSSLCQKDSLAIAVSRAREAMGSEGNQWYRPVLYLRCQEDNEGGQLAIASTHSQDIIPKNENREKQRQRRDRKPMNSDFEKYLGSLEQELKDELIKLYGDNPHLFMRVIREAGFPTAFLTVGQAFYVTVHEFISRCQGMEREQLDSIFYKLYEYNQGSKVLDYAVNLLNEADG